MSKIDFQDGGYGGHLGFLSAHLAILCLLGAKNAHQQVSIRMDYRGEVRNMHSQHFSHINV